MRLLAEVAGMQAAVYHGCEDIRVESVEAGALDPTDVRIAVEYCGICGTDLHEYTDGPLAIPAGDPHPSTGEALPLTIGHEFSGRIADTGADVDRVAAGDRVVVNPIVPCGSCRYCEDGTYTLCETVINLGIHGNGGMAESAVVPASTVHPLPADIPLEHGALVEPLSVALHAVRQSGLEPGDTVAVFGAGPIGLGVLQMARAAGARAVYVSEPRPARRAKAAELGATETVDPDASAPVEVIQNVTGGGVDVAVEAAGVEATLSAAIHSTRKRGVVTVVSSYGEPVSVMPDFVMIAERTIVGSYGYASGPPASRGEFGTTIQLLSDGRLAPEPMITGRLPLGEVGDAFESLLDPAGEHVKVLIEPE